MSPLSDGRQETGGTWKQSLSSEGDTGPSPRTSGMAMKPPALQRQSSIVIPSMVPTQEVLQNLSRYRSDSGQGRQDCHSVEHMESDEETLILGQRVISNQENSDGSIAITYDDISLIPSPFLLSAPQTQPFYSTTPTTRAESVAATTRAESVAALRDERRITPPSRANLPAYNANVTLASAAAARKPTAKETKGKEGTKDEIDDEDSDPIMDFDDTDDDRDKGKEVEVCKEQDPDPIVSTLDPPFLPPTTGAGNLRSPSRRFVLPVGATGKSNIGPRGQHHQQQGNLKDSPNGRKLRPASMVPQPIPPPFLHVQQQPWSPRSRGNGKGAVSPTQKLVKARQGMVSNIPPGSPPSTTNGADSSAGKKTPTRSVSAIGRSLRNIIPPAPLGPQLLQIAKDEQDMEHERKRRRLEKSKAVEQEIDVAYLPQGDEMVSRGAPMSLLPASITKQILSTRPTDVFSSNSLVQTSRTSSTTAALVAIKQEPLTQIMAPQENVALDTPILTSEPLQPPAEIPLPGLVLEYASKLTPIDQIKWPPAKPGRFHIFGLIMSIGLEEQIVSKAGQGSTKRLLSVCDQSATSFKLDLWRERCRWGDLFRPGDVVLITDVQTKEYRQKVTGNTSAWSRMSSLDGSALASYRGHPTLETFLRVFIDKRRVLALDLLDSGKGIARGPSYYLSLGDGIDAFGAAMLEQERRDPHQRTGKADVNNGLILFSPTGPALKSAADARSVGGSRTFVPMLPSSLTGVSIRASVVYRMLISPEDESQGWEVGACTSNGRFVKIHCQNAKAWISNASPRRMFHFFGRFGDNSDILKIDAASKEPYPLSEDGWNANMKNIEARRFDSIRSLRQHKFMGNAILDAYILAVSFPDLVSSEADQIEYDMLGFIQCYCTGCQSAAVSSPQNPSILFCPFCHLDPQRNHHPLEWMYPGFELSLGDKPRLAANLSSEGLQLRCQYEIGDQVFLSVPARKWTQSEEGFQRSRMRWKRLVQLMNNGCGQLDRDEEEDAGRKDSLDVDLRYRIPQKVRVEVRVGVNMMTKALKVDYL